ncbi:MAG: hypothetical protein ACJAQ1_001674 [Flavobacterium sp.]
MDLNYFKRVILNAPSVLSNFNSNVIISFPNEKGIMVQFKIFSSPIMEEELALKFPNIKTYLGKGINDPTAMMRFSITDFGFHAMTLSGKFGVIFIDTYTTDLKNYIVYDKTNFTKIGNFECGFDKLYKESNKSFLPENFNVSKAAMVILEFTD